MLIKFISKPKVGRLVKYICKLTIGRFICEFGSKWLIFIG
jgi:hypothetical protein